MIGAVERQGRVIARVVDDVTSNTVRPFVRSKINFSSDLVTDEAPVYDEMKYSFNSHKRVNHSKKEYVRDDTYTNTIEGFWSQLKRSIDGTFHMISDKYLQRYLNEFLFRYNYRNSKVAIFGLMLRKV